MDQQEIPQSMVHPFDQSEKRSFLSPFLLGVIGIAIALGVGTGFLISRGGRIPTFPAGSSVKGSQNVDLVKGTVVGSSDTETFKDLVEGTLAEGGIDGEGQYHLVRVGGESQYVYLTSSIIDLSTLMGRKIKAWGQTQKAQKAGWLMDVGRVEILE